MEERSGFVMPLLLSSAEGNFGFSGRLGFPANWYVANWCCVCFLTAGFTKGVERFIMLVSHQ